MNKVGKQKENRVLANHINYEPVKLQGINYEWERRSPRPKNDRVTRGSKYIWRVQGYAPELLARPVPVNKELFTGTVPVNNELFTETVPANNELFTGTDPLFNLFLYFHY